MASIEVTSDVFKIDSDIQSVYSFLSDFNKMGVMFNLARQMSADEQIQAMSDKIEKVDFTNDACSITVKNMGDIVVKIVEKEEPRLIKIQREGGIPAELTVWIQLLENAAYDTRMRITLHLEMNMMLKMVFKRKMEKIVNQIGEALSKIPYRMMG